MTAIWTNANEGKNWELADPKQFLLEANLHDLVEDAPHVLPLSGSPRLVVLGREVRCGSGFVDLMALERGGRLVLIEVKLADNSESRRAVVAQLLAYAAAMRGLTVADLNRVLEPHFPDGESTVNEVMESADQEGEFNPAAFEENLAESLATGRFRLVFVLDSAPEDLVRLVGYLEAMTDDGLIIDLVTVAKFEAGNSQILVPQRVEPGRSVDNLSPSSTKSKGTKPITSEGIGPFEASIGDAPSNHQAELRRLADFALSLEAKDLVHLFSTQGTSRITLVPRLKGYNAGLVTIVNDKVGSGAAMWIWRSVIEKRAPQSVGSLENALGVTITQGMTVKTFSDAFLEALRQAHGEAMAS